MKIHTRLLILLLSIALVPLILSTIFYGFSAFRLSRELATDTREQLLANAISLLHTLVDEYGQILKRDETEILLALHLQAREVEHLLASSPTADLPIYFSADFARQSTQPEGLTLSTKHFRPGGDGSTQPIPVTYRHQVFFLPSGVVQQSVAADLAKLAAMPEIYRLVHDIRPDLFLWQYTALEKGIHSSFPGKGGYPNEYDPREREWYLAAKSSAAPISRVITDLSTRTLILTMAMPVYRPDGEFAGVTAIDVTYHWLFADWKIPDSWKDVSEAMILLFHDGESEVENKLEIIFRDNQQGVRGNWQMPVQKQFLEADEPLQLNEVFTDLQARIPGVRKVRYQGRDFLWAYGASEHGRPFPLISLPYEQVVAQANRSEAYAREQVVIALQGSVVMLFGVVILVSILAMFRARTVTRPVQQLADAAKKLSEGNFDIRVDIRTGDELEALGDTFNMMGGRLLEREQMKQSLALAREIQQHLLPLKSPQLDGFDIIGGSLYCDETGGDYYDYIELGMNQLGLVVGDVSGHGIGSAMVMTTARGILRSQASHLGTELIPLLETLNRHLERDTGDSYFMTLFYAVLESETRICHWISGGHGPILHYSPTEKIVSELPCSGIPLGILEETAFEEMQPIIMSSGNILLVGTDGIWETRNPQGELFGIQRMSFLLEKYSAASAAEIYTAILAAVVAFRDSAPQDDDVTLVVIKAS